jgi:hypothetical protein
VDIGAEDLDAGLLIGFQERCSGEADVHGVGQDDLFHGLAQLAGLRAVTFIDEDVDVPLWLEVGRQIELQVFDIFFYVALFDLAALARSGEFVDQRTEQPVIRAAEFIDQSLPALCAFNFFSDAQEDILDLFIQLGAIGNDQDASVGDIFIDPACQPDHGEAFAATLRVPDDATLAAAHTFPGCDDAEVLM